jgi:hypothetical protein
MKSTLRDASSRLTFLSTKSTPRLDHVEALFDAFDSTCREFVKDWAAEQERLEKEKEAKEALFHYK